jgi:hypothetical protein
MRVRPGAGIPTDQLEIRQDECEADRVIGFAKTSVYPITCKYRGDYLYTAIYNASLPVDYTVVQKLNFKQWSRQRLRQRQGDKVGAS